MRKKTESLTFPKDPLAAMRELQELDAPSTTWSKTEGDSPSLPTAKVTAEENKDSGTPPQPESAPGATIRGGKRPDNPLHEAILQMLGAPYTTAPEEGPFTVTSVKMATELWNRLGLAATLTGRPKQELVAEALQAYLASLYAEYVSDAKPPDPKT